MSKIEWTQKTWNPVVGCSHASPGCDHCYAERMAKRQVHMGTAHYADTVKDGHWTGEIGIANEKVWDKPHRWKKPKRIFVCSMGDLFHAGVSDEAFSRVMGTMCACERHTFQILTKRPDRMRDRITAWCNHMKNGKPLPNVWLGVTAENQEMADKRIPILLDTPAAIRFVSVEPMLGAVDLVPYTGGTAYRCKCGFHRTERNLDLSGYDAKTERCTYARCYDCATLADILPSLDWVIGGGESGPGARPMHPDWIRGLRDQCKAAGVPFLFKQWGAWHGAASNAAGCDGYAKKGGRMLDGVMHDEYPIEGGRV